MALPICANCWNQQQQAYLKKLRSVWASSVETLKSRNHIEAEFDGKKFARRLSAGPGVYLMRDDEGTALYVGKAAQLAQTGFQLF